jgi:hypothetical protein
VPLALEWYALKQRGELIQYTGHGITNRAEMRILAGLLKAGYIHAALSERTLAFHVHHLNNEAEAPEGIAAFTGHQLVHSETQAVP